MKSPLLATAVCALLGASLLSAADPVQRADLGVGAKPVEGAQVVLDGTKKMLDEKWTYWQGPGFKSSLPIKWQELPIRSTPAPPS
jgi:hypothetical protein